jgi:hypothetical protein
MPYCNRPSCEQLRHPLNYIEPSNTGLVVKIKGYAVVDKNGRIQRDKNGLCSLLIFALKWQAENARLDGEKVKPVSITVDRD